jgi:uncharacterized RDD family membrane protein YckC
MSFSGQNPNVMAAGAASGQASGPRAGFWQRFAAAFMDGVIIVVIEFVLIAVFKAAIGSVLTWIVGVTYFTYFEGGPRGQTLGKRAMGIRVVDFDTGGPIGYGRAFIRYIGRIVSAIVFYLGYLWMLWDREKQCWHDKFASDLVVPALAYPVQ